MKYVLISTVFSALLSLLMVDCGVVFPNFEAFTFGEVLDAESSQEAYKIASATHEEFMTAESDQHTSDFPKNLELKFEDSTNFYKELEQADYLKAMQTIGNWDSNLDEQQTIKGCGISSNSKGEVIMEFKVLIKCFLKDSETPANVAYKIFSENLVLKSNKAGNFIVSSLGAILKVEKNQYNFKVPLPTIITIVWWPYVAESLFRLIFSGIVLQNSSYPLLLPV
ncbi:hypothetical protein CROQUDRAFT_129928 [Cronartium quercuum f. sp. fusiforme G11]|uniref:Uncharacterized protein n=1 Tax=Cronartium quercuum f. sp. fusiforme G11 TaxID=708437 RepID=A0A9P6NWK4_9BASI|nr:hypothetical protein CROQUDRAFT_129928 [Cronartium quercuum f. sp. fusiforme G11]